MELRSFMGALRVRRLPIVLSLPGVGSAIAPYAVVVFSAAEKSASVWM